MNGKLHHVKHEPKIRVDMYLPTWLVAVMDSWIVKHGGNRTETVKLALTMFLEAKKQ